jgi:hypothetical protein
METFIEILGGIVLIALLAFLVWYYFAVYRVHRAMSYTELLDRLRRNRTAYNRLNEAERNSKFGKQLSKSIHWCDTRLKGIEKATGRTTGARTGNYGRELNNSKMRHV